MKDYTYNSLETTKGKKFLPWVFTSKKNAVGLLTPIIMGFLMFTGLLLDYVSYYWAAVLGVFIASIQWVAVIRLLQVYIHVLKNETGWYIVRSNMTDSALRKYVDFAGINPPITVPDNVATDPDISDLRLPPDAMKAAKDATPKIYIDGRKFMYTSQYITREIVLSLIGGELHPEITYDVGWLLLSKLDPKLLSEKNEYPVEDGMVFVTIAREVKPPPFTITINNVSCQWHKSQITHHEVNDLALRNSNVCASEPFGIFYEASPKELKMGDAIALTGDMSFFTIPENEVKQETGIVSQPLAMDRLGNQDEFAPVGTKIHVNGVEHPYPHKYVTWDIIMDLASNHTNLGPHQDYNVLWHNPGGVAMRLTGSAGFTTAVHNMKFITALKNPKGVAETKIIIDGRTYPCYFKTVNREVILDLIGGDPNVDVLYSTQMSDDHISESLVLSGDLDLTVIDGMEFTTVSAPNKVKPKKKFYKIMVDGRLHEWDKPMISYQQIGRLVCSDPLIDSIAPLSIYSICDRLKTHRLLGQTESIGLPTTGMHFVSHYGAATAKNKITINDVVYILNSTTIAKKDILELLGGYKETPSVVDLVNVSIEYVGFIPDIPSLPEHSKVMVRHEMKITVSPPPEAFMTSPKPYVKELVFDDSKPKEEEVANGAELCGHTITINDTAHAWTKPEINYEEIKDLAYDIIYEANNGSVGAFTIYMIGADERFGSPRAFLEGNSVAVVGGMEFIASEDESPVEPKPLIHNIIVNGKSHHWAKNTISYDEILVLLKFHGDLLLTVTYAYLKDNKKGGSLKPGERVEVMNCTSITATHTGNA